MARISWMVEAVMSQITIAEARGGIVAPPGNLNGIALSSTPIWTASDPLRQLFRSNVAVGSKNIYFTLGARESDVWVMNLSRK